MTLRQRLAARVTDIRDRGQRLVQLNLELLASELKEKGKKFGAAIGMFVAAGLLALYAIGFLLATIVALLALALPLWASLLIVTAVLFIVVAVLALAGRDQLRKIGDPKPEAAIAEAKATSEMMKANARGTLQSVRERIRPKKAAPVTAPAASPFTGWTNGGPSHPPAAGPASAGGPIPPSGAGPASTVWPPLPADGPAAGPPSPPAEPSAGPAPEPPAPSAESQEPSDAEQQP